MVIRERETVCNFCLLKKPDQLLFCHPFQRVRMPRVRFLLAIVWNMMPGALIRGFCKAKVFNYNNVKFRCLWDTGVILIFSLYFISLPKNKSLYFICKQANTETVEHALKRKILCSKSSLLRLNF